MSEIKYYFSINYIRNLFYHNKIDKAIELLRLVKDRKKYALAKDYRYDGVYVNDKHKELFDNLLKHIDIFLHEYHTGNNISYDERSIIIFEFDDNIKHFCMLIYDNVWFLVDSPYKYLAKKYLFKKFKEKIDNVVKWEDINLLILQQYIYFRDYEEYGKNAFTYRYHWSLFLKSINLLENEYYFIENSRYYESMESSNYDFKLIKQIYNPFRFKQRNKRYSDLIIKLIK